MKKSLKCASFIAAALFAVSPVVTSGVVGTSQTTVAHAATTLTMEQLNEPYYQNARREHTDSRDTFITLTKKTPYLVGYRGETVKQLKKRRVKDVTSNLGRVTKLDGISIYPAMDDGDPDFGNVLHLSDRLKSSENYVALLWFKVTYEPENDETVVAPLYAGFGTSENEAPDYGYYYNGDTIGLLVPVQLENAPAKKTSSTTKVNKRGYVTARKGKKVRTYTSTGKFSKHYVYGHKTYRLNRKKNIKGHGTCYKIYGKNQWIPKKYLKLR